MTRVNLGTVNRRPVRALTPDGEPLVGCKSCGGRGSHASGQIRGWRSECYSCRGSGLTIAAVADWKRPATMPELCGAASPYSVRVPCARLRGHRGVCRAGARMWMPVEVSS